MHICVPIDGSSSSERAFQWALEFAHAGRDQINVLFVQDPEAVPALSFSGVLLNEEKDKMLAKMQIYSNLCKEKGVAYMQLVDRGTPRNAIIDFANRTGCSTIVMGSRGLGAVKRLLIGSVSDFVVHNATQSVVIVKETQKEEVHASSS